MAFRYLFHAAALPHGVKEFASVAGAHYGAANGRATLGAMKSPRLLLLALTCAAAPLCFAQWQWIDKDGRKVFSDQAPPANVQEKDILRRPGVRASAEPVQTPASASQTPVPAASAPRVSGKDKELENRKKQAQAAEAEKKKAQEDEIAKLRAENCDRARRSKQVLDSGARISTTNGKGEREIMDDAARTVEGKRLDGLIARDCKAA